MAPAEQSSRPQNVLANQLHYVLVPNKSENENEAGRVGNLTYFSFFRASAAGLNAGSSFTAASYAVRAAGTSFFASRMVPMLQWTAAWLGVLAESGTGSSSSGGDR